MPLIGYHASHEQFSPGDLLRYARAAQLAGFTALSCSDHFHPWSERQGESGHSWSWLGAAMATVDLPTGVVACPFGRYHPAVVAQAAATLEAMFPGRFWIALGTGEALNEHITGRPWPSKPERQAMLSESVDAMRALWRGEEVTHRGSIVVDRARLYTLPQRPPPIFAAALTEQTARWAGQWADGLITISGPRETMRAVIDAFREGGGEAKPVHIQAKIAYADPTQGDEAARRMAYEQWRTNVFDSETAANLATPRRIRCPRADGVAGRHRAGGPHLLRRRPAGGLAGRGPGDGRRRGLPAQRLRQPAGLDRRLRADGLAAAAGRGVRAFPSPP
ncbi:F420-dependent glucose-6-phosphate dehydrogenase [Cupriavidus sp. H18C1]|uniref:TIGR03557 family F420-dependent LLM class oxidoreductase n=1 Tax=Cupriavidus sp. H18C1 TaxID=3241601 RepID=UPI003BB94E0F